MPTDRREEVYDRRSPSRLCDIQYRRRPASLVATDAEGLEMAGMKKVDHDGRTHWLDRCKGHTVIACRRGDLVYAAVSTLPEEQLSCLMMDATHEGD